MRTTDIQVGGEYAVIFQKQGQAHPVKGTVVALGEEVPGKNGLQGIRVRLDEPMYVVCGDFVTGFSDGRSEWVISPRHVLGPWRVVTS
jgi:hypothetical protein